MRKAASLLFVPLFFLFSLSGPVGAEPLKLASYANPPYANDLGTGMVDLAVREAFSRSGIEVEIIQQPIKRGLALVSEGSFDGTYLRVASVADRFENLTFVQAPLFRSRYVGFTSKGMDSIRDWESLKSKRVAYPLGWLVFEKHQDLFAEAIPVEGHDNLLKMLLRGRADVILHEQVFFETLARQAGQMRRLAISPVLEHRDVSLILNSRHASLAEEIARNIRDMLLDGSLAGHCPVCAESLTAEAPSDGKS